MKNFNGIPHFCSFLFFINTLLFSITLSQEQGKIRGFENEAKPDTLPAPRTPSTISSTATFGESSGFDFIADAIGYVFIGALVQFPGEDSSIHENTFWKRGFSDYPYADFEHGMFSLESQKTFAFSFSGHYFSDGNNLTGYCRRLFISPHQSFNLEAHVIDLSEKLKTKTDNLRIYNFFIDYNRIKSEWFSLWWGLGVKGVNGPTVNKSGFALNSGFEIFPFAPISVTMNSNVGFINTKTVHEFMTAGNWYINRYNLVIGYQRFTVGNAVLDGMILGCTAHF